MILAVVRHAESVENADKCNGFYQDRRPYSGQAAHDISRNVVGLTPRGFRQSLWLGQVLSEVVGPRPRVYTSQYRRAIDTALVAFPSLPDGVRPARHTPIGEGRRYKLADEEDRAGPRDE